MSIKYEVKVAQEKGNQFHITWFDKKNSKKDSFLQEALGITVEELNKLQYNPGDGLEIGRKLFRFLDGDARHLKRALEQADQQGESLQVYLNACEQTTDWPFELLAENNAFLLPHRLHLVRYVSDWGTEKEIPPKNQPLKLLFMACSAMDVKPELDFEQEEEAIFQVTENLAIDMEVDDSGSLEGLRSQLEQEQYDVVHLSGHADIDTDRGPYFIMENEVGYKHRVYPDELWEEALIENPPRLLFLSGCRTGEAPHRGAVVSFAHLLVEKHHVPAVLGWGRPVSDRQAIHAEKMLYHELSRGRSILEAVQRVRYELAEKYRSGTELAWPLLRLFSSGMPLNPLVQKGQRQQPKSWQMTHIYLKNRQARMLKEGFVGRRRQLQHSLRTLTYDYDKVGLLLHGTAGLGKSCLAGKICERLNDHTLIIVPGELDANNLAAALTDAFYISQDEQGKKILSKNEEMTKKLANLSVTSFKEKNYLLLLDDFQQNLEGGLKGQPDRLLPEAAELLKVLLHYLPYSGKMTRLIITCRYLFSLTEQAVDLVKERLESICITSFQEVAQRKKAQELKNISNFSRQFSSLDLLAAGRGNPSLMESLDLLLDDAKEQDEQALSAAVKNQQVEFNRKHGIRELIQYGGKELELFLKWCSVYRRPVQIQGIKQVAAKAGMENWEYLLQRGIVLSLVEHDQAYKNYRVTPLMREDLWAALEPDHFKVCHQEAFIYYQSICTAMDYFDPHLVEEWIFHALVCEEEDTASKQAAGLVEYHAERFSFRKSRNIGEWVLVGKKQALSTEHDAFLLNKLAQTLFQLGEHRKAIDYFQQALKIDEALFGRRHATVARELNNLGLSWSELGDFEKAVDYLQQSIDLWEKIYGEKHPQTAAILNNLGSVWLELGNPPKAREYFQQALEIFKELHGHKHPQVAAGLNNLGTTWLKQEDAYKALNYFQQALDIWREVYGEKHPRTAEVFNNIGLAWFALDHYNKALDYFNLAKHIDEAVLEQPHPITGERLKNLGLVYLSLGQEQEAKKYFEQAYGIFSQCFGEDHPITSALKHRLWLLLSA